MCFSVPHEVVKRETLPVLEKEHNYLHVVWCPHQVVPLDETDIKTL